jgi:hypothetical protein
VTYGGEAYELVGVNGEELFDPAQHGLHVEAGCTAIWGSLNADNRVSLCAKTIDPASLTSELAVINQYEKVG